jgi:hypothetical protein
MIWHDEIENIECKIMATLGFGLEMMVLFDSLYDKFECDWLLYMFKFI